MILPSRTPHPPTDIMAYRELAKGAIAGLKERAGSSLPAIKKYLGLDASKNRHLNAALAAGVKAGYFVKNKGKYKLSAAAKKKPKKAKKKSNKAAKRKAAAAKRKKVRRRPPFSKRSCLDVVVLISR